MAVREFHPLRVAAIERLCDDAVAVTFDVPAELAGELRVPARAVADRAPAGRRGDERRTYSICAPAGGAAADRGARGARRPDLQLAGARPAARRRGRGGAAVRDVHARPGGRRPARADRGRVGHHAGAVHRRVAAAQPGGAGQHPVREPARRHGDVRRGAGRPQGHAIRRGSSWCTCCPARRARSTCSAGGWTRRSCAPCCRCSSTWPAVDHWWLCGPFGMVTDATEVLGEAGVAPERIHRELFWVDEAPPEPIGARSAAPDGAEQRGHGDPGRPVDDGDRRRGRHRAGGRAAVPARPAVRLQGRGVRHLPGAGSSRARSRCAATSRWSRPRWPPGSC